MSSIKIKPILLQDLSIQNLYHFYNFLRRKPKHALNFKFQCPQKSSNLIFADGISQNRLFNVIKNLKVLRKADLSQANIRHYYYANENKTISIYKKLSQVPIVSIFTYSHFYDLDHKRSFEKWPRLFTKVQDITYQITLGTYPSQSARTKTKQLTKVQYLQRNLKFCQKLQSFSIKSSNWTRSPNAHEFERYPTKLKRLVIQQASNFQESNSSLKDLKNLESVSLVLSARLCLQFLKNLMTTLFILPNIQEIDLEFREFENFGFYPLAFNQIATKALPLRKLKLNFDKNDWVSEKIITALQDFHELTSFTLSLKCNSLGLGISECIKNMTKLQDLKLTLFHSGTQLQPNDNLQAICEAISQLAQLEYLKLSFNIPALLQSNTTHNSNSLISLNEVFVKPVKLKTFSVTCIQNNPQNMYFALFKMLESSNIPFEKLKIDLGSYHPENDHQRIIISFLKSLSKIRSLKFPSLDISDKKFLNEIAEAVQNMRNLEKLVVDQIKNTVTNIGFIQALTMILKKRGLKRLGYTIDYPLFTDLQNSSPKILDLKDILQRNPHYELGEISMFRDEIFYKDW